MFSRHCDLQMFNVCVQVPGWVAAALAPNVTLTFLDTDGVRPAAAVEDSLAPGGGVINTGACVCIFVCCGCWGQAGFRLLAGWCTD